MTAKPTQPADSRRLILWAWCHSCGQPGLFEDRRPREFVTRDSAEYFRTLAALDAQGAVVESIATVPGHNAWWRLLVRWPANGESE